MASSSTSDSGGRRYRPTWSHRPRIARRPTGGAPRRLPPVAQPRDRVPSAGPSGGADVVLDVRELKTYFFTYDGVVRALDGVNVKLRRGETTGLVGETGCGKSVTAFSIARLVSEPGRVMSGKVLFHGADLLWGLDREARFRRVPKSGRVKVIRNFRRIKAANERMAAVRGRGVAMIFQEPSQAMNPVFSIADQVGEALVMHRGIEVIDGLLAADKAWREARGLIASDVNYHEGGTDQPATAAHRATTGAIENLVHLTVAGTQEELRAAAEEVGRTVGLHTMGTELFYLLKRTGPEALGHRGRIRRAIRRVHISNWQRSYLVHQRRLMLSKAEQDALSLREMRAGRSYRLERRRIQLRALPERLKGLRFSLWGIHRRVDSPLRHELFWRTVELLEGVRIANPVQVARGYPHELSGGMLQRVMIAMALSCEPDVLLADEPTTALDVTIQAQILELMHQMRERVGTGILLITHDLGVVAEVCDRVNVMYAGLIVESAPAKELFRRPLHPYTQGLLASIPRMDQPDRELSSIPGSVPNLITPPPGCRFHPRCPYAMPVCKEVKPVMTLEGPEHTVACHLFTTPSEAAPPAPAPPA